MRVLSADAATAKGLAIANQGIFAELSPEQLQNLQAAGEFRTYANEVVAADAQPLDTLFHILRGEFEVSKADPETGVKVTLAKLGPDQAFGEMSFLSGTPASANVLAKGQVFCWTVTHERLRQFVHHQPGGATLAMNLATLLADRVREGNTRLVGMSSTLSAYFGRAARLSKETSLPAPRATEHARLEIPTRVFDAFAREALDLGGEDPLTDAQRETVRARIANNDLDLIPWLERGQTRSLQVRIRFYEEEEEGESATAASGSPLAPLEETTVLRVPQTQAQIAPDVSYIDRMPGKTWWIAMAASIALLPLVTAFIVVYAAPLDSRKAVVTSKTFLGIPGHRTLERAFIRRDVQTYPITLAQDEPVAFEVGVRQISDAKGLIERLGEREGPLEIDLRVFSVRPEAKLLEERTVLIQPGDASVDLFTRRLEPGRYRLELGGRKVPGGPTSATITVRTEQ